MFFTSSVEGDLHNHVTVTRFTQKFVQLGQSRNFTLSTLMVRPHPSVVGSQDSGVVKLKAAVARLCAAGHGLDGFDPDLGG